MPGKKVIASFFAVFILILLSATCLAQNESERWPYYSQFVDFDLEMGSGISIIKTRPDAVLDLAIANLTFVPLETERQRVLSFDSVPEPTTRGEEHVEYIWHHPMTNELDFEIKARMRGYNTYTKIPKKVGFPIVNLPPELLPYLEVTPNINSNDPLIREIASQLAEGEDDLFVVVHKIALWTKENINYSLSTLTADVSQPASWVLENRQGVCDELTSLFIAMLRSVGIPAKFISGVAYTDLPEFTEQWGGHGWAEVYFPGYGWTEWDVTYGEFGFIDPTHFKLKESLDSDETATTYIWQGRGVDATAKEMRLTGDLQSKFGTIPARIRINSSVLYKSVGPGSYNLVQAEIKNLEDSYISTIVYLAPTQDIEMVTDSSQIIYIKPKSTTKVFWIIRVSEDLDEDYIYTFPISVVSLREITARSSFVAMKGESLFTEKQMQDVVDAYEREKMSRPEAQLSITCQADKQYYYGYDAPRISCAVKNTGNTRLSGLDICLETDCRSAGLMINQEKVFDYGIETLNYGKNQLILSAGNADVSKSFVFDIYVLDDPKITVKEVIAPENVTYKENFTIDILLERVSSSRPQNVTVIFTNGIIEEEWAIGEMVGNQRYLMEMRGSNLKIGNNTFKIQLDFTDLNGKPYSLEEEFRIDLVNVTIWERMSIFFHALDQRLRKLFK